MNNGRIAELAIGVYKEILKGISVLRAAATPESNKTSRPSQDMRRQLEQQIDETEIRAVRNIYFQLLIMLLL
jgi:hypothetical protein